MNIEWITLSMLIAFLVACWGISVYEFGIMGLPFSYCKGWDRCALGLSYGIMCGLIIYILTVSIPVYLRKKRNRKTIYVSIVR